MFFNLLSSVIILFLLIIPGFALSKCKIEGAVLAKGLSNLILYGTQPALLMYSFLVTEYDTAVFINCLKVLALSFLAHGLFFWLSSFMYKGAEHDRRVILRFASVFSNAGYMGIPLINYVFGAEATIYASVYIIGFNVFAFSLGFLLYTGDKSYVSPKKILINPATVPIGIALLFFVTGLNRYIPSDIIETMGMLKDTVAPLAMIIVGLRLAEVKWKGIFKDKFLYEVLAVRLLVFPIILWAIMFVLCKVGVLDKGNLMGAVLICSATPSASATSIFAEKFNGDALYAGKVVAVSTIFSVITMPLITLLLKI